MAIAIQTLGSKAISLTGAQIGIKTDSTFSKARIKSISTERMRKSLDEGNIVIAAGFQGDRRRVQHHHSRPRWQRHNGRGVGRGAQGDTAEIYTDVDGVYTTDPRQLPEARRVKQISYDEMLELAVSALGSCTAARSNSARSLACQFMFAAALPIFPAR